MFRSLVFFVLIFAFCAFAAPFGFDWQTTAAAQDKNQTVTAEQVVETAIALYGGRERLAQIRRTEFERGRVTRFVSGDDPRTEETTYEKRTSRGESVMKDRIRVDQKTPVAEYALIYDANKVFGLINNSVFVPREEAEQSFQAGIFNGLDALLRYKENGSTLELAGKDKQLGVEFYNLTVTDKEKRKTLFHISAKTFRVISLEYDVPNQENAPPTHYIRRFYDYRIDQGTLVPHRTVLYANGRQIETTNLLTVTYGAKIEDNVFKAE